MARSKSRVSKSKRGRSHNKRGRSHNKRGRSHNKRGRSHNKRGRKGKIIKRMGGRVSLDGGNIRSKCVGITTKLTSSEHKKAVENEKLVTPLLRIIAKENGGELRGLENKIKTPASLNEKIKSKCVAFYSNPQKSGEYSPQIWDALRYTLILSRDNFRDKMLQINKRLNDSNIRAVNEKNSYCAGNVYKGINNRYVIKDYLFEIQFHTIESLGLKSRIHEKYEEFRREDTPPDKKCQLYNEMMIESDELAEIRPPCSFDSEKDNCDELPCSQSKKPNFC